MLSFTVIILVLAWLICIVLSKGNLVVVIAATVIFTWLLAILSMHRQNIFKLNNAEIDMVTNIITSIAYLAVVITVAILDFKVFVVILLAIFIVIIAGSLGVK